MIAHGRRFDIADLQAEHAKRLLGQLSLAHSLPSGRFIEADPCALCQLRLKAATGISIPRISPLDSKYITLAIKPLFDMLTTVIPAPPDASRTLSPTEIDFSVINVSPLKNQLRCACAYGPTLGGRDLHGCMSLVYGSWRT